MTFLIPNMEQREDNGNVEPEQMDEDNADGHQNFLEDEEIVEVIDLDDLEDPAAENSSGSESESEEPIRDDSHMSFALHTKPVFCVDIHPEGKFCVSGGKDDVAYVWNVETGQELYKMEKFIDSIIIAAFSFDGKYMGVADMAGTIQVRKCPNNNMYSWDVAWEFEVDDISWGFWHPSGHVFIASTSDGSVYMWKIPSGDSKILCGSGEASLCGELFRDGKKMAVAYSDGWIKIWDLKNATPIHQVQYTGDADRLISIDINSDIVVAGNATGNIYGVKANDGKKFAMMDVDGSAMIIRACKNFNLGYVAVAVLEGGVIIWEALRHCIRYRFSEEDIQTTVGVVKLLWVEHYLLIACSNGTVRIVNSKTAKLEKTLFGHKKDIYDMAYLPSSSILVTCSEDKTCRLFKLDLPA